MHHLGENSESSTAAFSPGVTAPHHPPTLRPLFWNTLAKRGEPRAITKRPRSDLFSCLPPQRVFVCFATGTCAGASVPLMGSTLDCIDATKHVMNSEETTLCSCVSPTMMERHALTSCLSLSLSLWSSPTRLQSRRSWWQRLASAGIKTKHPAVWPQPGTWPCLVAAHRWLWHRCLGLEAPASGARRWPRLECAALWSRTLWGGRADECVAVCEERPMLRLAQRVVLI